VYSKTSGYNLYRNTNSSQNYIQTAGTSLGSVTVAAASSMITFGLVDFIPGTWTVLGSLQYDIV